MINGVKSATISSAYASNIAKDGTKDADNKSTSETKNTTAQSKTQMLKERIESGEYKIDLDQVAKKMAEELLS